MLASKEETVEAYRAALVAANKRRKVLAVEMAKLREEDQLLVLAEAGARRGLQDEGEVA